MANAKKMKMPSIFKVFKPIEQDKYKEKTAEERRKELKKSSIKTALIFTPIVFIIGLYIDAYLAHKTRTGNFFTLFSDNPFFIFPIDYKPIIALIALFVVPILMLARYSIESVRVHNKVDDSKGGAHWNTVEHLNSIFKDPNDFKNAIVSKNCRISTNSKYHYHMLSTLVIGSTGSGKTRFNLKPNLMQMNTSYVVCDPSGDILAQCGESLRRFGYKIKIFDSGTLDRCSYYNPLSYVETEVDLKNLVEAFMENMNKDGGSSSDPFWDKSFNAFLSSLIAFLTLKGEGEDKPYCEIPEVTGGRIFSSTLATCAELTRMAGKKYTKDSGIELFEGVVAEKNDTELGIVFKNLKYYEADKRGVTIDKVEGCYALDKWDDFCIAPEKTASSILMVSATNLDAFNIQAVRDLTSKDTINLYEIGDTKSVYFLLVSVTELAFTFLTSFLYTQMFSIIYKKCEGQLKNYSYEGTSNIYLENEDLVRHFTRNEVIADKDKYFYDQLKNGRIDIEETILSDTIIPLPDGGYNKDAIYDLYYNDLDIPVSEMTDKEKEERWISARPTMALAEELKKDLRNVVMKEAGKGFQPVPSHVRFLMDEFKNTARVPAFPEKLATMRKYEIDCTIFIQDYSQLEEMYEKNHGEVMSNCPQTIFLAGVNPDSNKKISDLCGQTTKILTTHSIDGKKNVSTSQQIEGTELIKPDDLAKLPFNKMLYKTTGEDPIIDDMYDYVNHPKYIYTYDYAVDNHIEANIFDRDKLFPSMKNNSSFVSINKAKAKAIPTVTMFDEKAFCEIAGKCNVEDSINECMNEDYYNNMDDIYDGFDESDFLNPDDIDEE